MQLIEPVEAHQGHLVSSYAKLLKHARQWLAMVLTNMASLLLTAAVDAATNSSLVKPWTGSLATTQTN
jgi:hypothetical protein